MAYMTGGGGRWDGFPRGFLDRQIAKEPLNIPSMMANLRH
jgi:hypothetical protein